MVSNNEFNIDDRVYFLLDPIINGIPYPRIEEGIILREPEQKEFNRGNSYVKFLVKSAQLMKMGKSPLNFMNIKYPPQDMFVDTINVYVYPVSFSEEPYTRCTYVADCLMSNNRHDICNFIMYIIKFNNYIQSRWLYYNNNELFWERQRDVLRSLFDDIFK